MTASACAIVYAIVRREGPSAFCPDKEVNPCHQRVALGSYDGLLFKSPLRLTQEHYHTLDFQQNVFGAENLVLDVLKSDLPLHSTLPDRI